MTAGSRLTRPRRIALATTQPGQVAAIRDALASRADLELTWVTGDLTEAGRLLTAQGADLVLLDLDGPGAAGPQAVRALLRCAPAPILLVAQDVGALAALVYDTLAAGALGAVSVPHLRAADSGSPPVELLRRIDLVLTLAQQAATLSPEPSTPGTRHGPSARPTRRLVAIGASAGGPAALATLLRGLPADFDAGIVIVQHIDAHFTAGMARWLDGQCALPVRLIEAGDAVTPGEVLLAGTNQHLEFLDTEHLGYTRAAASDLYCPSIDVFFHSVARRWPHAATGVLLTGMGRDGAAGLKALRDRGHHTIAQDSTTSAVYGMPKAAAALNAAIDILPVDEIATRLAGHPGTLVHHAPR